LREITAKQLKNNTGEVLRRVRAGEAVTVTVRGVRIARFVPLAQDARARGLREDRKSMRALIRSGVGKYRGLGTVEEFLKQKARETAAER